MTEKLLRATERYIDATKKLDRMKEISFILTIQKYNIALQNAQKLSDIRKKEKDIMFSMIKNATPEELDEWYKMIEPYIVHESKEKK